MKKKLYYPTKAQLEHSAVVIAELCEEMAEKPVYKLYTYKPLLEEAAKQLPWVAEFLELEPEEMLRRHKMGIEAAKMLILR
jgi:hypothetical protein